jgi:hypothetical protein
MTQTIIYKVPGRHRGPKGTTYDYKGHDSAEGMPEGWHDSLDEAINGKPKRKRRSKAEMEAAGE